MITKIMKKSIEQSHIADTCLECILMAYKILTPAPIPIHNMYLLILFITNTPVSFVYHTSQVNHMNLPSIHDKIIKIM